MKVEIVISTSPMDVCYIEKLVSTVFIYGERTERLEKDEENKFFMALNELKAILNIITSLVE